MPKGMQTHYGLTMQPGFEGQIVDDYPHYVQTYQNAASDRAQIAELTAGTAGTQTYNLVINGNSYSYGGEGSVAADLELGLAETISSTGEGLRAVGNGSGTITITGEPGVPFTISASGGGAGFAATTTQTAVASADIPPGRALVRATGDADDVVRLPGATGQRFVGVSALDRSLEADTLGGANYRREDSVPVMRKGQIWARPTTAVSAGGAVYFSYGTTAPGAFASTAGSAAPSDCDSIPGAQWDSTANANELAKFIIF